MQLSCMKYFVNCHISEKMRLQTAIKLLKWT